MLLSQLTLLHKSPQSSVGYNHRFISLAVSVGQEAGWAPWGHAWAGRLEAEVMDVWAEIFGDGWSLIWWLLGLCSCLYLSRYPLYLHQVELPQGVRSEFQEQALLERKADVWAIFMTKHRLQYSVGLGSHKGWPRFTGTGYAPYHLMDECQGTFCGRRGGWETVLQPSVEK